MGNCGLVLAGGGARGAYEAGVLYYLFCDGPREVREKAQFRVLSGTSVGALNVSALAATAHQPAVGIRKLVDLWRSLKLDGLIPLGLSDIVSIPAWLLGRQGRDALLPGGPIKDFLHNAIDWDRIHVNLAAGHLEAVSLSCTHVPSGRTVVFYETRDGRARPWSRDPHVRAVHTRLGPPHARASGAIPLMFPAVSIDGIPYVDGGLRQNTPLSPALRLGADRILVIGMSKEKQDLELDAPGLDVGALGRPIFMLGKVLNALMLDHVDYDLVRLEHFNLLLRDGERAFGRQFTERLNNVIAPQRNARYRIVPHLTLRPSQDMGRLAAEYARSRDFARRGGFTGRLLSVLARAEPRVEADLTSYVMFDGGFADLLINLGMEDAHRQREALMRFFDAPAGDEARDPEPLPVPEGTP